MVETRTPRLRFLQKHCHSLQQVTCRQENHEPQYKAVPQICVSLSKFTEAQYTRHQGMRNFVLNKETQAVAKRAILWKRASPSTNTTVRWKWENQILTWINVLKKCVENTATLPTIPSIAVFKFFNHHVNKKKIILQIVSFQTETVFLQQYEKYSFSLRPRKPIIASYCELFLTELKTPGQR